MHINGTSETILLIAGAAICFGLYKLFGVWIDGAQDSEREDER